MYMYWPHSHAGRAAWECYQGLSDCVLHFTYMYLCVGTLRPDLIESASALASSNAHVIKTHHNDTELVRELRKKVGALV